jgi:hypothetical protein
MEPTRRIEGAAEDLLGTRARWGAVGYAGEAFAPAPDTYLTIRTRLAFSTVEDSGEELAGAALANLHPLVAAALYEAAFAMEAGPLSTWTN